MKSLSKDRQCMTQNMMVMNAKVIYNTNHTAASGYKSVRHQRQLQRDARVTFPTIVTSMYMVTMLNSLTTTPAACLGLASLRFVQCCPS